MAGHLDMTSSSDRSEASTPPPRPRSTPSALADGGGLRPGFEVAAPGEPGAAGGGDVAPPQAQPGQAKERHGIAEQD